MSQNRAAAGGFTLVEVLIALVIVSVAVLALGGFGLQTIDSGQVARERLTAVHLAEQVLEQWQNDAKDRAPAISSSCTLTTPTGTVKYPVTTTCTPTIGSGISYTVKVDETTAIGPLASDLNNFQSFSKPSGYTNTPMTKLVSVTWTQHSQSRTVYLTHMTTVR